MIILPRTPTFTKPIHSKMKRSVQSEILNLYGMTNHGNVATGDSWKINLIQKELRTKAKYWNIRRTDVYVAAVEVSIHC